MKLKAPSFCLAAGILAGVLGARAAEPPPAAQAAMDEYWRHAPRYGCLCCSVYNPAPRAAAVPRQLGSMKVLQARLYDNRARLACWDAAGPWLWVADDVSVRQIDVRTRALARTFTAADGLPDAPVRQLLADGSWLWILGADRLSRLRIADGTIEVPNAPSYAVARLGRGPAGTFLVTEEAAYRWNAAAARFDCLGAYGGQGRVARTAQQGFWQFEWFRHWDELLRQVVVGPKALYVLAGNTLSRFDLPGKQWRELDSRTWRVALDGAVLWALTTAGPVRYDARSGELSRFGADSGAAQGRPVGIALADRAPVFLAEPRFDKKSKRFEGGGISCFDPAAGRWDVTRKVGEVDLSFPTWVGTNGGRVLAAARLAGGAENRSLHPGMARVRRYVPKINGLAVAARSPDGSWQAIRLEGLAGEHRWVMGQRKRRGHDRIRPQRITKLLVCGERLWAVLRNFPERYYGGYYESVQCVARREGRAWRAVAEPPRCASIGLAGDHPSILCLTATHGSPVVLAHEHPRMLALLEAGGTPWIVQERGVYAYDASADRFGAVLIEPVRAYWQVTAGACGPSGVWFGSDAGTITRLDSHTGRFQLVGVVPGRRIEQLRTRGRDVWARTTKAKTLLPPAAADAPKLPAADVLHFDGQEWSDARGAPMPQGRQAAYRFKRFRGDKTVCLSGPTGPSGQTGDLAFVQGAFEPQVLCAEDPETLWIKVWSGVGRLSLAELSAHARKPSPTARQETGK